MRYATRGRPLALLRWPAAFCVLLAVWQLVSLRSPSLFVADVPDTMDRLLEWAQDGSLWEATTTTTLTAVTGLVLGASIGTTLAVFVGAIGTWARQVTEPWVVVLYAVPKFVFVPILYVAWGNGLGPRILLVVLGIVPIMFVSTMSGIRSVDQALVTAFKQMGATPAQLGRKVLVRFAFGYVFTGLVYATSMAFILAVGGEILFGGAEGLGGMANSASARFDAAGTLAATVAATVVASVLLIIASALAKPFAWTINRGVST